jgi:hypothetical protein
MNSEEVLHYITVCLEATQKEEKTNLDFFFFRKILKNFYKRWVVKVEKVMK